MPENYLRDVSWGQRRHTDRLVSVNELNWRPIGWGRLITPTRPFPHQLIIGSSSNVSDFYLSTFWGSLRSDLAWE